MSEPQIAAQMEMDLNALRILHRVVVDAHTNWSGGDPEEQNLLAAMRQQLYAALMENLLRTGQI
ncbi:MAG: hypothetical protein CMN96_07360 [Synechococcus sp. MED850]|nr:hypothetical protein [Synechococcus sp. MED850]